MTIDQLIKQVNAKLDKEGRGSRARLAEYLEIRIGNLCRFTNRTFDPPGPITLKLLDWLAEPTAKAKSCEKR